MSLLKQATLQSLVKLNRTFATKNSEISAIFTNRNPRNLEKLRIAYKPDGYHVDKPGRSFWHKLHLSKTSRYLSASVEHFENGTVVKASTQEWGIQKQLYNATDTSAYINLARVLAQRCVEFGITEIYCNITPVTEKGKVAQFLKTLESHGVMLTEASQYKKPAPSDLNRPEKPWEISE